MYTIKTIRPNPTQIIFKWLGLADVIKRLTKGGFDQVSDPIDVLVLNRLQLSTVNIGTHH